jgi:hypothetical protein
MMPPQKESPENDRAGLHWTPQGEKKQLKPAITAQQKAVSGNGHTIEKNSEKTRLGMTSTVCFV